MAKTNITSYGDGIVYSGVNPYGALYAGGDELTGCPIMTFLQPDYWAGAYNAFMYEVRKSEPMSYGNARIGASVDVDAVQSFLEQRRLFQIKRDKEAPEGAGLDDGIVNALMLESHTAVLRGLLGVFSTGKLTTPGGLTEDYWGAETPEMTADAPWSADGNPLNDIEDALDMQQKHGVRGSLALILAHDSYKALINNTNVKESSLWQHGSPNGLQLRMPRPLVPLATSKPRVSAGDWMFAPTQSETTQMIGNPLFDLKGLYNGMLIIKDKAGLIPSGQGVLLPCVDAAGNGYRAVYGKADVGGEMVQGAEIVIAKRSNRSGAVLSSYTSYGLKLTDGNPYHSIALKGLV